MRSKIAVLGDKESVLGFKAVGFDVFESDDAEQAQQTLRRIIQMGYGIIFITEQTFVGVTEEVDKYKTSRLPAIIPIPGREGSMGIGLENVRKSVERAVGADILFNDK